MKTGMQKCSSSLEKDLNRVRKVADKFYKALLKRKIFHAQTNEFIDVLLKDGRTTKEELKKYFKKIK